MEICRIFHLQSCEFTYEKEQGENKEEWSVLTEAISRVFLFGVTKWKARGRIAAASQMFSFSSWIFCFRNLNVSVAPAAQMALRNQGLPGKGELIILIAQGASDQKPWLKATVTCRAVHWQTAATKTRFDQGLLHEKAGPFVRTWLKLL